MPEMIYLCFGPNPSVQVRAGGRRSQVVGSGYRFRLIQVEPYLRCLTSLSVPRAFRRTIGRVLGKVIAPFIVIFRIRLILRASVLIVVKSPPFWLMPVVRLRRHLSLYDFDDPMWLKTFRGERWFGRILNWHDGFVCDNELQHQYASQFGLPGYILPGCLPASAEFTKSDHDQVRMIWAGSPSTFKYLEPLMWLLSSLAKEFNAHVRLLGVTDQQMEKFSDDPGFSWVCEYGEVELAGELAASHIGLFPLDHDELSNLRGVLKPRVYQSAGLPVVASDSRLMSSVISEGLDGFICSGPGQWECALRSLLSSRERRLEMARASNLKSSEDAKLVELAWSDFLDWIRQLSADDS